MGRSVAEGTVTSRSFRTYLFGFGASLLADSVWFVCLGWAASRLADPFTAALVMTAGTVPRAVVLLVGGAIADHAGPLRVALASQQLRLLLMAVATVVLWSWGGSPIGLAVLAGVFGLLDALHMPATASLPPLLLNARRLPDGQGLVQTTERLAGVMAAPIAGLAIGLGGIPAATAVAAGMLAAASLMLVRLRGHLAALPQVRTSGHRQWSARRMLGETYAGLRYSASHPIIGPILLVITAVNLALSAPLNLGLALAAAEHRWTATGYGLVLGAFGAGAALGALSVLKWRPQLPARAGLLWVAAGSITLGLLSLSSSVLQAAILCGLLGFTSGPAGALLLGLVQAVTPTEMMGRVMSLVAFSALGVAPLANILFGTLAQLTDLSTSFIVFACAELATTVVALSRKRVRHANTIA